MAAISSYATSSPVVATDKWIGSDASSVTKNFTASDVRDYINPREIIETSLTSYTYQLSTQNNTIVYTGTGASIFTIPPNSSIAFEIGCEILTCNSTVDTVTPTAGVGVTLNGTALIAAGESKRLKKTDTDTWFIY